MDNRYLAELVGTFTLVFAGCGAVVVDTQYGGVLGHLGINMVFGLVVMAVIYSIGNVSGAHINPAVTISFAAAGLFEWRRVAPYILAQLIGAALAGVLLLFLFPGHETYGSTLPSESLTQSFAFEVVISFLVDVRGFQCLHRAYGEGHYGWGRCGRHCGNTSAAGRRGYGRLYEPGPFLWPRASVGQPRSYVAVCRRTDYRHVARISGSQARAGRRMGWSGRG